MTKDEYECYYRYRRSLVKHATKVMEGGYTRPKWLVEVVTDGDKPSTSGIFVHAITEEEARSMAISFVNSITNTNNCIVADIRLA